MVGLQKVLDRKDKKLRDGLPKIKEGIFNLKGGDDNKRALSVKIGRVEPKDSLSKAKNNIIITGEGCKQ